jgi:hypothetical protein
LPGQAELSDGALAQVFNDHARIASLDLHAVVTQTILHARRCVATFNVLATPFVAPCST